MRCKDISKDSGKDGTDGKAIKHAVQIPPQPKPWSKQEFVCGNSVVKQKITAESAVIFLKLVDSKGIEPSTSAMRKGIYTFFA